MSNIDRNRYRVLMTGPDGFIGRNLRTAFAEAGVDVAVLRRRRGLTRPNEIEFTYAELSTTPDLTGMLGVFDQVIHLAGRAHRSDKQEAWKYWVDNVRLTEYLLEVLVRLQFDGRVFYASSALIYGTHGRDLSESADCQPVDAYAMSKLAATECVDRAAQSGIRATSLVLPLVYGRDPGGNLLSVRRFVARGVPFPLLAPSPDRSFLAVDNLASLLIRSLQEPIDLPSRLNVCDPSPIAVDEFLRAFLAGLEARFVPVPAALASAAARVMPSLRSRTNALTSEFTLDRSRLCEAYPELKFFSTTEALGRHASFGSTDPS